MIENIYNALPWIGTIRTILFVLCIAIHIVIKNNEND